MQPRPSPTSPASKVKQSEVADVWRQGNFQQPLRTPWGRIVAWILVLGFIVSSGMLVGVGWLVHRYPQSWLTRFVPLTATTTTVIQPTKEVTSSGIPAAVETFPRRAYGIARNQGADGMYAAQDVTGISWPLSSSGWVVSLTGAWPADVKTLVLIPDVGQPQAVTSTIPDPATPFIFLKTSDLTSQPVAFAPAETVKSGTRVWVVSQQAIVARQLTTRSQPKWVSSDIFESVWLLDAEVTLPVGSGVVDADGRLVGVLGTESRVWPVSAIETVLKQVIQSGSLVRPVLGVRYIDQGQVTTTGQTNATGLLIGADEGQVAITPKGPGEKAGLKSGDIILTLDRQVPTAPLQNLLQAYAPTDKISLTLQRNGKEVKVEVQLGSTRS